METNADVKKILDEFASVNRASQSSIRRTFLLVTLVLVLSGSLVLFYFVQEIKVRLATVESLNLQADGLNKRIEELSKQEEKLTKSNEELEIKNSKLRSELANVAPFAPPKVAVDIKSIDRPVAADQIASLVAKLGGDERLVASNQLIDLYAKNKKTVVTTLVSAILPKSSQNSYRVNLYVAFTLGRIKPGWEGTDEQFKAIKDLLSTSNAHDSTFKKWVTEAIKQRIPLPN